MRIPAIVNGQIAPWETPRRSRCVGCSSFLGVSEADPPTGTVHESGRRLREGRECLRRAEVTQEDGQRFARTSV
jgi:hypothetical protein